MVVSKNQLTTLLSPISSIFKDEGTVSSAADFGISMLAVEGFGTCSRNGSEAT